LNQFESRMTCDVRRWRVNSACTDLTSLEVLVPVLLRSIEDQTGVRERCYHCSTITSIGMVKASSWQTLTCLP